MTTTGTLREEPFCGKIRFVKSEDINLEKPKWKTNPRLIRIKNLDHLQDDISREMHENVHKLNTENKLAVFDADYWSGYSLLNIAVSDIYINSCNMENPPTKFNVIESEVICSGLNEEDLDGEPCFKIVDGKVISTDSVRIEYAVPEFDFLKDLEMLSECKLL